jgi:hypothetical protein
MAYQVPKLWAHGDIPTGAEMQKYVDAINAINSTFGVRTFTNAAFFTEGDNVTWSFIHRQPFLWYKDGATLYDPFNPEKYTESLSKEDGSWQRYDLRNVKWLYIGKLYCVYDADGCMEHWR